MEKQITYEPANNKNEAALNAVQTLKQENNIASYNIVSVEHADTTEQGVSVYRVELSYTYNE